MQSTVAMQGIWRRIAEPGRALASAKPWSIDYLAVSTGFLLAFLLIDWVTFTPAFAPRGVTPWNPAIGFALAVVLRYGLGLLPILVVAPLISDVVVPTLPFPFQVVLLEAVISGVGYAGATWVLLKSRWRIAPRIETVRDLLTLIITTSLATMLVAVATIAVLSSAGLMRPERAIPAFWRFWIGDIIGILVVLPFLLKVAADGNGPRVTSEPLAQLLAILGTIAIMFASPSGLRLPISYILFLPIVWIAVRGGLARVASGLVIMQIALMIAIHITADDPANIASYQALMVALSVSGLTIGVLTDERVRGERDLRRQQDAIARAARIGTLGEMATAVAHELNQPLTAAANYARATVGAASADPPALELLRETGLKTLEQVERSAAIIRRLRDYISVGRLEVGAHQAGAIISECIELMRPEFDRSGTALEVYVPAPLPPLSVDRLQIETVLTNLLRNAVEAIEAEQPEAPHISISAIHILSGFVEIAVADNGIGFPSGFRLSRAGPIASTKAEGLGIGLSLCQSIIESHGGRIEIDRRSGGATVRMTLPVAGGPAHA